MNSISIANTVLPDIQIVPITSARNPIKLPERKKPLERTFLVGLIQPINTKQQERDTRYEVEQDEYHGRHRPGRRA